MSLLPLHAGDHEHQDVEMKEGLVGWLPAQQHSGHNIGDTNTHVIFVELKEAGAGPSGELGPTMPHRG